MVRAKDRVFPVRVYLGAGDAAAHEVRQAHAVRLEVFVPRGDAQHSRRCSVQGIRARCVAVDSRRDLARGVDRDCWAELWANLETVESARSSCGRGLRWVDLTEG